ncbi:MAG: adenylate/guanylate cyclase domain-containing protein [Christiangramia sp.]|uniref:adenylate/guanylate cyclase domain-containing protein n=1 Tax=Christiangramia sp. TaxID=1931228 RepID=UPI0032428E04
MKKGIFTLIFIFGAFASCLSQNQAKADSLEKIYLKNSLKPSEKLEILKQIAEEQLEPEKKIAYANRLIKMSSEVDSASFLFSGHLQKANAFRLKGDFNEALKENFIAASIASKNELQNEKAIVNITIADVYSLMGSHKRAVNYYHEAIEELQTLNDSASLASAMLNLGDEYFQHQNLDSALYYFNKSGIIFRKLNYETGLGYNLGNMGLVYAAMGENKKAEDNMHRAVQILERNGDFYPVCVYLRYMADVYLEKGQDSLAMGFALQSLDLARSYGLKDEISESSLKVSQLYENSGDLPRAFQNYKEHIVYRDSVRNLAATQEMANLRADYEVAQKQIEVDLLNQQRRNQRLINILVIGIMTVVAFLAFMLHRRNRYIKKTSAIIEREKNRSERLLLNILPEETAMELKENGHVRAKKFEKVSVLFADFKDFSRYAEHMEPERLLQNLDYYFSEFDKIVDKYNLEKIKTLGDCYMIAGGLPFPDDDHPRKIVAASFEIMDFVNSTKRDQNLPDASLEVRIGIHTGPVVAGVVGHKKFAYDIWGDTVNIASRLQTASEAGKINVSENTCMLVKDFFECHYRGEIEVKNRGILKMYYLNRPSSEVHQKKTYHRAEQE